MGEKPEEKKTEEVVTKTEEIKDTVYKKDYIAFVIKW